MWDFFTICQDKKFAKGEECAEVVSRGGDNVKSLTTSNLVSHLRANHQLCMEDFASIKTRSKAKDKMLEKKGLSQEDFQP